MKKDTHIVYEEDLFVDIIIFYKTTNRYLNSMFSRKHNLSMYEVFFLLFFDGKKDSTYYDISKSLPFDKSYINKTLKKLEEKNLIIRRSQGRKKCIELTENAKEFLDEKPKFKRDFIDLLRDNNLSKEELASFLTTLKKLTKIMSVDD